LLNFQTGRTDASGWPVRPLEWKRMESMADRNTLVDDTANRIRRMIFTGQIKPGEMLPPRKVLAVQFAVGIATVHEAVKSLGAVGLLESRPGKGTWVSANALDSIIHPSMILNRFGTIDAMTIYEARLVLEVAIAELAAEKATPDEVQKMIAALDAAHKVIDDDEAFVQADWGFHLLVAQATHNVLLEAFYNLSREMLLEFIRDVIRQPPVRHEGSRLHRVQVDAIARHDVEGARQAAREHMVYLKQQEFSR
jgi:GntR family transcriptional regulator, transcriptional repressor for pyruvate dehydrogenase complex